MTAPTFREKMLDLHGESWVTEQEEAHAAKFPPKVTAADVLAERPGIAWSDEPAAQGAMVRRLEEVPVSERVYTAARIAWNLAHQVADLRNAAREAPDDEAWIEVALEAYYGAGCATKAAYNHFRFAVRDAYRARAKK